METSGSAPPARRRRGVRLGVAGAVLAFLALTTVQAVGVNPYQPPDELYHVGYALVVRDRRLPELTTQLPQDEVPLRVPDHGDRRIYTANHPPLYYLPVSLALRIGSPPAAFLTARLVTVAFGAAGVLLVAWLALALLPSRPRVAIGAAWFAALLPAVPQYSAFVYNDALGFMASTGAMVAAVLALRRGPSFWRLAALTLAAAAAALTRAPGIVLVGVAGLAAAAAWWLHSGRKGPGRAARALGAGALVGGIGLAGSAWFYLRNRALYGDLTGARYNAVLNHTPVQHDASRLALSPRYLLKLFDGLWVWTRFALTQIPVPRALVLVPRVLALVVLAGLLIALVRVLVARRSLGPATTVAPWLLVTGWLLVGFLMVAWYDGNGGRTHARYLLPVIGVAAVLAAVGLDALPGARRGLVTLVTSVVLLGLTAAAWGRFTEALLGLGPYGAAVPRGIADPVHQHGVPHAWLLLVPAALALLVAIGLQQGGYWLLAGAGDPTSQAGPADPEAGTGAEAGSGERQPPRADADLRI
jgi:hypothetical protein